MKVYKENVVFSNLEREIERLKLDKRKLEKINNKLTKELKDVRKALARIPR